MLTDDLLTDFADALRDRSESKSPPTPVDPADADVPRDVARLLSAVGGWNVGDLRFIEPSALARDRAMWSQFVADFEAGTSDNWCHAFWNPAWYPLASTSYELYAYDPVGHFNGQPGQLVCLEFKGGTQWVVFPSLCAWLTAFKRTLQADGAEDPVFDTHRRAASGHELCTVDLPELAHAQRSPERFRRPLVPVRPVDTAVETNDFTLYRLYALSRGRAPQQVLGEVAHALDTAMPYRGVRDLEGLELDDAADLARQWATPVLTQNASRRDVSRLFFGVDVCSNQMALWMWPCAKDEEPTIAERRMGEANPALTPGLTRLHERLFVAAFDVGWDARGFVYTYLSLLARAVLDACAGDLPWDAELDIILGSTQLGRCDRDGFVPLPLRIAHERMRSRRERNRAWLAARNGPPPIPVRDHPLPADAWADARRLRHPDGRAWEVNVGADQVEFVLVDSDGERTEFTRPLKTGWEAETLIAAQLREGFIEL